MDFLKKVIDFIRLPAQSRTMGLLIMLVLVSAVSLTVIVAQQQQQIKQRASGTFYYCTKYFFTDSECTTPDSSRSPEFPGCKDSWQGTLCESTDTGYAKTTCFQDSSCASTIETLTRFTCSDMGGDKYRCQGDPDAAFKSNNHCDTGWTPSPYNDSIGTTCWKSQICCYQSATATTTTDTSQTSASDPPLCIHPANVEDHRNKFMTSKKDADLQNLNSLARSYNLPDNTCK
jgi:hypothetical protein